MNCGHLPVTTTALRGTAQGREVQRTCGSVTPVVVLSLVVIGALVAQEASVELVLLHRAARTDPHGINSDVDGGSRPTMSECLEIHTLTFAPKLIHVERFADRSGASQREAEINRLPRKAKLDLVSGPPSEAEK